MNNAFDKPINRLAMATKIIRELKDTLIEIFENTEKAKKEKRKKKKTNKQKTISKYCGRITKMSYM